MWGETEGGRGGGRTHLVLSELMEDLVHPGENLLSARDRLGLLLDLTGRTGLTALTSGRVEVLLLYFNLKNYGGKLAKHYYVIWNYNQLDQALFNFCPAIKQLKEKTYFELFFNSLVQRLELGRAGIRDDGKTTVRLKGLMLVGTSVSVFCKIMENISSFHRCKMMENIFCFHLCKMM